jgi:hypothetical protein
MLATLLATLLAALHATPCHPTQQAGAQLGALESQ